MTLSPWHLIQALLFALGVYWCRAMYGRWYEDYRDFRETNDYAYKAIIAAYWLATLVIAGLVVRFAWNVIAAIVNGVRGL